MELSGPPTLATLKSDSKEIDKLNGKLLVIFTGVWESGVRSLICLRLLDFSCKSVSLRKLK